MHGLLIALLLLCGLPAPLGGQIQQDSIEVSPQEPEPATKPEQPSETKKGSKWNPWNKLRKPVDSKKGPITGVEGRPGAPQSDRNDAGEKEEYTGGEWFAVPIPIVDPTIQTGLAGAGGYIFRLNPEDDESPDSITGAGALGTSNGTWGVFAGHQMAWGRDRWRMNVEGGYANANFDFGGSSADPGSDGVGIPVTVKGGLISGGVLLRVVERWFVGPRYSLFASESGLRTGTDKPVPPDFPPLTLDVKTSGLGFRVMRDSRDDQFYPRGGTLTDFKTAFNRGGIGSDFDYEKYEFEFNLFRGFKKRHVIAGRGSVCGVNGDTPFFDLCYLGQDKDLRGYRLGRYQGNALFATQAEYRLELPWRIGLVGFVGVGQVAPGFNQFQSENWLPGYGVGFRFKVAKKKHVNLRVDFAFGRDSSAIYISGGEAF